MTVHQTRFVIDADVTLKTSPDINACPHRAAAPARSASAPICSGPHSDDQVRIQTAIRLHDRIASKFFAPRAYAVQLLFLIDRYLQRQKRAAMTLSSFCEGTPPGVDSSKAPIKALQVAPSANRPRSVNAPPAEFQKGIHQRAPDNSQQSDSGERSPFRSLSHSL